MESFVWEGEAGCSWPRLASGNPTTIRSQSQKVICHWENLRSDFKGTPPQNSFHVPRFSFHVKAMPMTVQVLGSSQQRAPYNATGVALPSTAAGFVSARHGVGMCFVAASALSFPSFPGNPLFLGLGFV